MYKLLFAIIVPLACSATTLAADDLQIDAQLAAKSTLIIRAQRLKTTSGPQQPTDQIKVLAVLKSSNPKEKLGKLLEVQRNEFSPAISTNPCTVYLKKSAKPENWQVVGVSHVGVSQSVRALLKEKLVLAADHWQPLFEKERWYQGRRGKETVFRGKLEAIPQVKGLVTTLQRTSYYRLGKRKIYTGAKQIPALDKLVGKLVDIRGKSVSFSLEGREINEIWPAAIRIADPNSKPPKEEPLGNES